ncbi:NPC intracellular cholesterol transporter 2-like [Pollicipes pollicipes]|uniref:NPC intracellular cholesterol transporter 2-like n=1 Tax=Pollicipes pollicipes TaxID=41117 RepID=UPI001884D3AB|nr:NPC intracellular cholesterol transporter 2-like [Pollicipes pollicipes]
MPPLRCCLLLALLAAAAGQSPAKCGTNRQDVRVDNCGGKICTLRRGTSTGITITFRPDKPHQRLKTKVSGVVFGLEVPFAGVPSNACGSLVQGNCPLQQGQQYVYRAEIPVHNNYPAIPNVQVRYLLVDADTNEVVTCALIRVKIR